MKNGKILEFLKGNWHNLLLCISIFAGIFFGIRACANATSIDFDARRNVITIEKTK